MFTFTLPFFSLFLLFTTTTTTTAQPYKATDHFLINCGTSSPTPTNPRWDGDQVSKFVPSNAATTSFSSYPYQRDSSVPEIPYSIARIFNVSSFTYKFPVSQGPKFLRLFFYPASYSGLNPDQSFFSVSSNGFSLLTNFSAFLTASYLRKNRADAGLIGPSVPDFVKEFMIYVKDTQVLTVTFTPSPNSYAFINGIEIVSMPENLYFNAKKPKPVGMTTVAFIDEEKAVENMYRLNMGGNGLYRNDDTGMYRSWDLDNQYILSSIGLTPLNITPIKYTTETPNYTAPELVYATQRSMGKGAEFYNLTWILPVDSGFYYLLRLHFASIIEQYTRKRQTIFYIFINNQTAEDEVDLFDWTSGAGYAISKDYVVYVNDPDGSKSKQNLWLALHPNKRSEEYLDGFLNGLEAFKLSIGGSLASPNPELSSTTPPARPASTRKNNDKKTPFAAITGGVVGAFVLLFILAAIIFRQRRQVKHYGAADDRSSYAPAYSESKSTKSTHSTLPSDRCRRFSLSEVKEATDGFNENFVIGNGGFGKVYRGYMDNATTMVAIKRLNESSTQGFQEFRTEIGMLSKLRHVQLVSLIGYCDDEGEMILVYDYMAHGTLREHLYRTNNPPLSWKRRLNICIGAAKGLDYLHTGAKRAIIHRDVKSTNILLDENWVAKVSDFGLSKLGPRDQAQGHVSTVVKGSIGYVDPQYYRTQQLTDKSDVYSFGVVLLEVLCARPVMIPGLPKGQASLAEWGKSCFRKGALNQIIDPKLKGAIAPESLKKFGEVAVSCLQEHCSERPAMDEVVWGLEFALKLQEAAEKTVGEAMFENQEVPFLKQGEATTTDDDDVFTGSSAIINGTSSISSSDQGFKSETVFSELQKSSGR